VAVEYMCVTIVLKNIDKDTPLIIGNNRDEFVKRNFIPPNVISYNPYIVGGVDLAKGGTWLGINENHITVNLLNKFKDNSTFYGSDYYKSRGLLVTELLKLSTIDEVLNSISSLEYSTFLPFFMIITKGVKVFFVEYDNHVNIVEIKDDVFICGNLDPFNRTWEKYKTGYGFLRSEEHTSTNWNYST
jgi:uncharacterized protein with NRDE domain